MAAQRGAGAHGGQLVCCPCARECTGCGCECWHRGCVGAERWVEDWSFGGGDVRFLGGENGNAEVKLGAT